MRVDRKKAKKQLKQFLETKPPALAVTLLQIAAYGPMLVELLKALQEVPGWFPRVSTRLNDWQRYYRNPEAWGIDCLRDLGILEGDPDDDEDADSEMLCRQWLRYFLTGKPPKELVEAISVEVSQTTPREYRTIQSYVIRRFRIELLNLIDEVTTPSDAGSLEELAADRDRFRALVAGSTSLTFAFRVVIPCLVTHGVTPWRLLREGTRAKKPSLAALEKLLAIDGSALGLTAVQHTIWHRNFDPATQSLWLRAGANAALKKRPRITPRKCKYRLGRLMIECASGLGIRLTEPEVRNVFDWIAQARDGVLRDEDLPTCSETFSRSMREQKSVSAFLTKPEPETIKFLRARRRQAA